MSKLSKEQFEAYLEQIKNLAEGPFEEMQPEIEVTNVFPEKFYELRQGERLVPASPRWPSTAAGPSELADILRVQEQFSRGPGGMRMHLHYAADLNWHPDDYGSDELEGPSTWTSSSGQDHLHCFALTESPAAPAPISTPPRSGDENGDYILNGEKWLISHTDCCEFALRHRRHRRVQVRA